MSLNYASQVQKSTNAASAEVSSVRDADKSKPYIPCAGEASDGWSNDDEATATCFCGSVQLSLPIKGPGLVDSCVCNCTDCRKITASMFSSLLIVNDNYLKHLRGKEMLKTYAQNKSPASKGMMTNYFCDTCGTLMYRVSERFPGHSILRLGTVDDFNLAETKLKPRTEVYTKDRVSWLPGVLGDDVRTFEASPA